MFKKGCVADATICVLIFIYLGVCWVATAPHAGYEWLNTLFKDLKITDILLAIFTLALAIYTYQLWRSTEKLWKAGESQIAIAKQWAVAAINVELPRLIVSAIELQRPEGASLAESLKLPKVKLIIKNFGRTPAFIRQQSADIALFLPDIPVYPNAVDKEPGCVIEAKDSYELVAKLHGGISEEAINDILERKKLLWVYGFISYRDFLGKRGTMRFCAEFAVPQGMAKGSPPKWIECCPDKYTECHECMDETETWAARSLPPKGVAL